MNRIRTQIVVVTALLFGGASPGHAQQDTLDVFFLGNSYVYYNTLPDQLNELSKALASGPVIRTAHHLHGGFSLARHLADGHLPDALRSEAPVEGYDIVVVQEHSRLGVAYRDPERGTLGDTEPFETAAAEVVEMVRAEGAAPLFYMTWAKEDFPAQTEPLARAYTDVAEAAGARVAPVGIAFERVRNEHPEIDLFHPDGSHPSPAGTYLAALVFYSVLTGESPLGAPAELWGVEMATPGVVVSEEPAPLVRLPSAAAATLQRVAWEVSAPYRAANE